jgi:peptidoglycan/LPS O-acetylase OafA/YrhL
MQVESGKRRHFHTFDALRFFAFFKVFLLHLPIAAFPWFNFLKRGGGIGVMFFFVLSGFLITYIICEEKQRNGQLNLKNFFVRRILRIWPLYYLMVAVAYATPYLLSVLHMSASQEGYEPNIWASLLFAENYKMMLEGTHANASPLSVMWSLCIEEHFYIVWGVVLYYLRLKDLPKLLCAFILLGLVCRVVYVQYNIPTSDLFTNIDLFAYGAIPAYILVNDPGKLERMVAGISKIWKYSFIGLLLAAVTLCSQLNSDAAYVLPTSLLGILFAVLIAVIVPWQGGLRISDSNVLSRLGIYTYGLYMYHTLVINLLKQLFIKGEYDLGKPAIAIAFGGGALLLSVLCSVLSYQLFEKQFLKLKKYFR